MKTQNTKLHFTSNTVAELSDAKLDHVKGGSPVTAYIESIIRAKTYGTWLDFGL